MVFHVPEYFRSPSLLNRLKFMSQSFLDSYVSPRTYNSLCVRPHRYLAQWVQSLFSIGLDIDVHHNYLVFWLLIKDICFHQRGFEGVLGSLVIICIDSCGRIANGEFLLEVWQLNLRHLKLVSWHKYLIQRIQLSQSFRAALSSAAWT